MKSDPEGVVQGPWPSENRMSENGEMVIASGEEKKPTGFLVASWRENGEWPPLFFLFCGQGWKEIKTGEGYPAFNKGQASRGGREAYEMGLCHGMLNDASLFDVGPFNANFKCHLPHGFPLLGHGQELQLLGSSSLPTFLNFASLPMKFFVIGHDCAHKSFSKNKLVEDIVGTLAFLPLVEDTAWHPVWEEEFDSSPVLRKAIIFGYGPFRPWIMSTFTMVHHTAPHIPFKSSDEWNAAQAQLNGTIHCDYPCWIEILCHDINVHIPHHVSARIPHYNLRVAHKSLQENWGKITCMNLNLVCHVYDKEENHVAFDKLAPEESHPVTFLKRVMPVYA
ncbi:hypothetical protein POTOM_057470 [Populus tomentosa]|uniref:Fatty acid desaturase domain-containing protein n=1 Tax=Populus tomentosa TaxID=118781 RepID=A0A8X7Y6C1_POPTO|nr:hypothetical protein POTOM_057470 [Populus tomentosa]